MKGVTHAGTVDRRHCRTLAWTVAIDEELLAAVRDARRRWAEVGQDRVRSEGRRVRGWQPWVPQRLLSTSLSCGLAVGRHCGAFLRGQHGWRLQGWAGTTRLRAFRLPSVRADPSFESFQPFGEDSAL